MSDSEGELQRGDDLEATRPNPRLQAERERLRDDLKDIAEQNNSQGKETVPVSEEQARIERMQRRHDDFFVEGGISGYSANGKWIVENAVGQYISFKSAEDAFEAQKQSADRLAKREQAAGTEVPAAQAESAAPVVAAETNSESVAPPAPEQAEIPRPELSAEAQKAKDDLEDRVFSGSQDVTQTLFGGIMVKGQGETLTYRTRQEYEQAWQGYRERKAKREAEAREVVATQNAQARVEANAQPVNESRPQSVAEPEAQPPHGSATEKPPERPRTPERAEVPPAFQEAVGRRRQLENLMMALRGVTDSDLRSIEFRLQDVRDGSLDVVSRSHRRFTDAINMSARELNDAQGRAWSTGTAEAADEFLQTVKEQSLAIGQAYDEMSRNLSSLMYSGAIPHNSRIRVELGSYLEKTGAAKQQLARLAQ